MSHFVVEIFQVFETQSFFQFHELEMVKVIELKLTTQEFLGKNLQKHRFHKRNIFGYFFYKNFRINSHDLTIFVNLLL